MGLQVKTISSVKEARQLAAAAHYGQWVGATPFIGFLGRVESILSEFLELDTTTRIVIWLHEVLNTPINKTTITLQFGPQITGVVQAMTLPRCDWERAQLQRCAQVSEYGANLAAVLLASRIAESELAQRQTLEHYRLKCTHREFKQALGYEEELAPLWDRLEKCLD